MSALDDLVSGWPHRDAEPVLRMARVLAAKGPGYWSAHGRDRFARELGDDGLPADRISAALTVGDEELGDVDLGRILADLKRRSGTTIGAMRNGRRSVVGRLVLAILMSSLVACGGAATGSITGELVRAGGPTLNKPTPVVGTIYIDGENGHYVIEVPEEAVGRFSAAVEEGLYSIRGRSPTFNGGRLDCLPDQSEVRVSHEQSVQVTVTCLMR
jgi:hypothetical protein